jgi:uncharacterized protein Usg
MTLDLLMRGWRLTTAEILYHLPDHPSLLQTYLWQDLDLTPDFPALRRFLAFWESHLEGRLFSVQVCQSELIAPAKVTLARQVAVLH